MCGIIGYIGDKQVLPILIDGLPTNVVPSAVNFSGSIDASADRIVV